MTNECKREYVVIHKCEPEPEGIILRGAVLTPMKTGGFANLVRRLLGRPIVAEGVIHFDEMDEVDADGMIFTKDTRFD